VPTMFSRWFIFYGDDETAQSFTGPIVPTICRDSMYSTGRYCVCHVSVLSRGDFGLVSNTHYSTSER
jgi:hypothetical protein